MPNGNGSDRQYGRVKWWSDEKGYGFITPDDGSRDVFVHFRSIRGPKGQRKNLEEGQTVSYNTESQPKGPAAVDVLLE